MRGSYSFLVLDHLVLCLSLLFTQGGSHDTLIPTAKTASPGSGEAGRGGNAVRPRGGCSAAGSVEGGSAAPHRRAHTLTTRSGNHTSWYSHKEVTQLCGHGDLPLEVCPKFTYSCQNLQATDMPFRRSMKICKPWNVTQRKRDELTSHGKTGEEFKCV